MSAARKRKHFLQISYLEWLLLSAASEKGQLTGKQSCEHLKSCSETFHASSVYVALRVLHEKRVLLRDHRKRYTVTPVGAALLRTFAWSKTRRRFELRT